MGDRFETTYEGVSVVMRGDLLLIHYGADARIDRTKWAFDRADELAAKCPNGILALMIVAANAAPPDAETRKENARRFAKIQPKLRRMVTVPLGDSIQKSIVRAIMRALALLLRQGDIQKIAATEAEGVAQILDAKSAGTPMPSQIYADLRAVTKSAAAA